MTATDREALAEEIMTYVVTSLARKCLVLMAYDPATDLFWKLTEQTLRSQGFEPVRIDRTIETGLILQIFLDKLLECDGVVADVTGANPNVLYELGHAHARGIVPLLCSSDAAQELPFYLNPHKVEIWNPDPEQGHHSLIQVIEKYVEEIRRRTRRPLREGGVAGYKPSP